MTDLPRFTQPEEPFKKRLLNVMHGASYVQKKGRNKEQNYSYAQEADFLDKIKPLLVEQGIIAIPQFQLLSSERVETAGGKPAILVTLELTLTLGDVYSGETIVIRTVGQGRDPQDKSPYKAMTGAMKYALAKAFLVPTGDDPEDSEEESEKKTLPKEKGAEPKREKTGEEKFIAAVTTLRYKLPPSAFEATMAEYKAKVWPDDLLGLDRELQLAFYKSLEAKGKDK